MDSIHWQCCQKLTSNQLRPRADPGVQAVSPQVTISYPPGGRLPLLSGRPSVTFPAAEHHCPLAGTKLYCLATEAHRCEQLAQGCYAAFAAVGFEPTTCWSQVRRSIPVKPLRTGDMGTTISNVGIAASSVISDNVSECATVTLI